jgi:hypothetical protein
VEPVRQVLGVDEPHVADERPVGAHRPDRARPVGDPVDEPLGRRERPEAERRLEPRGPLRVARGPHQLERQFAEDVPEVVAVVVVEVLPAVVAAVFREPILVEPRQERAPLARRVVDRLQLDRGTRRQRVAPIDVEDGVAHRCRARAGSSTSR